MPQFGAINRRRLIYYLKKMGFSGPFSAGKHQLMIKNVVTLRVPNPHQSDISKRLLINILRQAKITREEWENL